MQRWKKRPRRPQGFPGTFCRNLALGELGSAAGCFESVFLAFLHSGVAGQESGLLQCGAQILAIVLQQRAGHSMADGSGLSGNTAAGYTADDVKLLVVIGQGQGLAYNVLQFIKAELIVYIPIVDSDLAGALVKAHASHGALSPACSVEIRCGLIHSSTSSFTYSKLPASGPHAYAPCRRTDAGGTWRCVQGNWTESFP